MENIKVETKSNYKNVKIVKVARGNTIYIYIYVIRLGVLENLGAVRIEIREKTKRREKARRSIIEI